MKTINHYASIIAEEVKNFNLNRKPYELYEPIRYILDMGGKRIRPALTLMSCDFFGGDFKKAIKPAMGIEMFHNFTLMHDDIMDKAYLRRGNKTVHIIWDDNRAILSGDAMLILANQLMLEVDDDILREVMELYNNYGLLVCDGQQYDMNFEKREEISLDEYLLMIKLKTAALLAGCLKLGAVIAKTSDKNKFLIEQFGYNLGISFQIQDDYLDAFGDFDKFGKVTGGDIIANKKTFLLIKALELADHKTKKELIHWYSEKSFNDRDKIRGVISIFENINLKEIVKSESQKYFEIALTFLDQAEADKNNKAAMIEFATELVNRDY